MAKLTPYNGRWNRRTATHLLWRAQSGASASEIEQSVKDGLGKTVERLLQPGEETEEFKQTEGILQKSATRSGDIGKLKAWWLYRMLRSQSPLTEKMTLLWHNHFATSNAKVDSVDYMLAQNELMRRESLGNFRQLLGDMARDTAMLISLLKVYL